MQSVAAFSMSWGGETEVGLFLRRNPNPDATDFSEGISYNNRQLQQLCRERIYAFRYLWDMVDITERINPFHGGNMRIYLDLAVLLNFVVDLLLLMGTNRIAGYPWGLKRCLLGAAIGGLYGGFCLVPGFTFMGNTLWRVVFLGLMGGVAFGFHRTSLRRILLMVFLSFALGGAAVGMGKPGFFGILSCACLVAMVCALGFWGGNQELVEVELRRGEKQLKLMALRDTGNTLTDPVTGRSVLVADAQSAEILLGLTQAQLADPVGTVASGILPGLRLIPYRAIGVAGGMLVAMRLEGVRIGNRREDTLVAFAPEGLGGNGTYRALTGGMA